MGLSCVRWCPGDSEGRLPKPRFEMGGMRLGKEELAIEWRSSCGLVWRAGIQSQSDAAGQSGSWSGRYKV